MKKVAFVCLGNICRSPMAEFVFKDELKKAGLSDDYQVESFATGNWEHGNKIHGGTLDIFKEHGIIYDSTKTSRKISDVDFKNFDYIYAMDENNYRDLLVMSPQEYKGKIHHFIEGKSVPDPYFTGDFDETYELVRSGSRKIIDQLK
ncbi:low molecular weight phosphotyrosine protein phosphatase [Streptococcaceae bacterium ESL0687]|nr:low molecular weight phosphotyrosine protein phosphatase [Streptococcaceae bacterium ESL0687]